MSISSINNTEMDLRLKLQKEFSKLDNEARFVLAVSGGKDSIALLDLASKLIPNRFVVAHFHHGLRDESDAEQEFVQNLTKKYAKTYSAEFRTQRAEAFDKKQNLEAWAREQRYGFLEQVARDCSANYIVTAHHKNDLAETVLMRIVQGRASFSTGGIQSLDNKLFRPMLDITRQEIDDYVEVNSLDFVEDNSNLDTARLRNKLRLELIPKLISEYNPSIIDSLTSFSLRLKNDEEAIWQQVIELFDHKKGRDVEFFASKPTFLRWRLLKLEMEKQVGESKVGYKALLRLSEALSTSEGSKKVIELGWGISCKFSRKGDVNFSVS